MGNSGKARSAVTSRHGGAVATRPAPASGHHAPGSVARLLADPASVSASELLGLQRTAGNTALSGVLQRNGTTTAIDPGIVAVNTNLGTFCDKGTTIAWELYRAVLQLESDRANDRYGRLSTDSEIGQSVQQASAAHKQSVAQFARIRQDGQALWTAIQQEHAKAAPDFTDLNAHVVGLAEQADQAARLIAPIASRAWDLALRAEQAGHLVASRHAFGAADAAEEVLGERRPRVALRTGAVPTDVLGVGYGVGIDTAANTIGGGTYGNIVSGITLGASEGSTLGNLATGTGSVLGPLAVLCSSINIVLGVTGAVKSHRREEQLNDLLSHLADPRAREVVRYAADQKRKKQWNRGVSTGVAVAGLVAGIAACVAIGVSTFGVGALAIGVVAAAIGLGLLAYKIYRKSRLARTRKMKAFAKSLIKTATRTGADTDEADRALAREHISSLGAAPANGDFATTSVADLATRLGAHAMSQREATADLLLELIVNGRRSERRDAELVADGLGLDPEKLRGLVDDDKGQQALSLVMGKLASW